MDHILLLYEVLTKILIKISLNCIFMLICSVSLRSSSFRVITNISTMDPCEWSTVRMTSIVCLQLKKPFDFKMCPFSLKELFKLP